MGCIGITHLVDLGRLSRNELFLRTGGFVVHGGHPSLPFGGDGGGIEVVDVSWFDPSMLAKGVIDAVFVVAISGSVGSHVSSEFEGVVSILFDLLLLLLLVIGMEF